VRSVANIVSLAGWSFTVDVGPPTASYVMADETLIYEPICSQELLIGQGGPRPPSQRSTPYTTSSRAFNFLTHPIARRTL
jgi:hypothetical protein